MDGKLATTRGMELEWMRHIVPHPLPANKLDAEIARLFDAREKSKEQLEAIKEKARVTFGEENL